MIVRNSRECDLVCEALVREIRDAKRWSAVVEAWEALLAVRRQTRELENDAKEDSPK